MTEWRRSGTYTHIQSNRTARDTCIQPGFEDQHRFCPPEREDLPETQLDNRIDFRNKLAQITSGQLGFLPAFSGKDPRVHGLSPLTTALCAIWLTFLLLCSLFSSLGPGFFLSFQTWFTPNLREAFLPREPGRLWISIRKMSSQYVLPNLSSITPFPTWTMLISFSNTLTSIIFFSC